MINYGYFDSTSDVDVSMAALVGLLSQYEDRKESKLQGLTHNTSYIQFSCLLFMITTNNIMLAVIIRKTAAAKTYYSTKESPGI